LARLLGAAGSQDGRPARCIVADGAHQPCGIKVVFACERVLHGGAVLESGVHGAAGVECRLVPDVDLPPGRGGLVPGYYTDTDAAICIPASVRLLRAPVQQHDKRDLTHRPTLSSSLHQTPPE